MDRQKLVDALRNVDPARSDKIDVAKGFWFTGTRIMAYNSEMAIAVPFKTDYVGSIQETILPLLATSGATECTFTEEDDHLLVKAGSSKFKLNTNKGEDAPFKMPKMPEDQFELADVPEFLLALKACLRSIGNDVSEQEFKGVTFIPKGKTLHMFGFERITLTHSEAKIKGSAAFERVIIPTGVVNQLLRIMEGATEMQMHIDEKRIICKANGITLWGHTLDPERNPFDFLSEVNSIKAQANQMIRIGKGMFDKFPGMIERAVIITQSAVDVSKTKIKWEGNKMSAFSSSTRGTADEIGAPSKEAGTHPDVIVKVDPLRLQRGLDLTRMIMTKRAVIFTNDEGTLHYFVSGT